MQKKKKRRERKRKKKRENEERTHQWETAFQVWCNCIIAVSLLLPSFFFSLSPASRGMSFFFFLARNFLFYIISRKKDSSQCVFWEETGEEGKEAEEEKSLILPLHNTDNISSFFSPGCDIFSYISSFSRYLCWEENFSKLSLSLFSWVIIWIWKEERFTLLTIVNLTKWTSSWWEEREKES